MFVCFCAPLPHNATMLLNRQCSSCCMTTTDHCGIVKWLAVLKVGKHSLVEKPLPGAIFELVARRIVLGVQDFGRI